MIRNQEPAVRPPNRCGAPVSWHVQPGTGAQVAQFPAPPNWLAPRSSAACAWQLVLPPNHHKRQLHTQSAYLLVRIGQCSTVGRYSVVCSPPSTRFGKPRNSKLESVVRIRRTLPFSGDPRHSRASPLQPSQAEECRHVLKEAGPRMGGFPFPASFSPLSLILQSSSVPIA